MHSLRESLGMSPIPRAFSCSPNSAQCSSAVWFLFCMAGSQEAVPSRPSSLCVFSLSLCELLKASLLVFIWTWRLHQHECCIQSFSKSECHISLTADSERASKFYDIQRLLCQWGGPIQVPTLTWNVVGEAIIQPAKNCSVFMLLALPNLINHFKVIYYR